MIHYNLKCAEGHAFDGWFASSAAYDRLAAEGAVTCPHCGSASVERALMAPAIAKGGASAVVEAAEPEFLPPVGDAPNVAVDERAAKVRAAIRAMRQAVIENGVDVGRRFPEEARRIHYGEAEPRGIYGQAEFEEAKELLDEGIAVLPLPVLPEDRN
jgi:hypothetical protein